MQLLYEYFHSIIFSFHDWLRVPNLQRLVSEYSNMNFLESKSVFGEVLFFSAANLQEKDAIGKLKPPTERTGSPS